MRGFLVTNDKKVKRQRLKSMAVLPNPILERSTSDIAPKKPKFIRKNKKK